VYSCILVAEMSVTCYHDIVYIQRLLSLAEETTSRSLFLLGPAKRARLRFFGLVSQTSPISTSSKVTSSFAFRGIRLNFDKR